MPFQVGPPNPPPFAVNINTQPDVIASLPPNAAEKLRMLRDHVDDLHRLLPEFSDRHSAGEARVQAEAKLRRLTDHPQDGGFALPDTDPRVKAAQRDLKMLSAESRRLTDNYERRALAWREAGSVLANVESWLSGGKPPGVMLRDHADEVLKLPKDTDVLTFVELQRRRGRELRADLNRISSSPLPSGFCKQRMREQIEALAEKGRPSVSRLVEHDMAVEFADEHYSVPIFAGGKDPVAAICAWQQVDAVALVCYLAKSELIAALDREIESEADDENAFSHVERERQAAEVQSDLLNCERIECAAVWLAMLQNLPVEHRVDVNPVALLNLALVVSQAVPSRGSSIEHAISRIGGG